jgi:hypothetical protein
MKLRISRIVRLSESMARSTRSDASSGEPAMRNGTSSRDSATP